MTDRASPSHLGVLVFDLGALRYGVPAWQVRELHRAVSVVPLPSAPAIVEGVINVRGEVTPVLDIRKRFRLPAKPLEPSDHLVVAWAGTRLVAIRADRAAELVEIDARQIEDAKRVVPGSDYVAGVAKLETGLLLIHDLETFLDAAEATILDEALQANQAGDR